MGLGDMFRLKRAGQVADSTRARGLGQGTHSENCERCDYSTQNRRSPTGLSCTYYKEHVPANGKCGMYRR